ncbi:MAG: acyloxyacyl hydrolase [Bacteroidia bacterium]|nr:acyloxyacyl hydrolase [Bacteroidia bacterium]
MRFVLWLFFIPVISTAASGTDSLCFSVIGHYGFILPHSPSMSYIIPSHIYGAEVNVFRRTGGERDWERTFGYPETGLHFFFIDLQNPGVTGRGFALDPYLQFPLFTGKSLRLHLKTGAGIGYLTEKFDRIENHKNVTIGSHINAFADIRLSAAIQWSGSYRTDVGIGFAHFSNGAWTVPNLGFNCITLNMGLAVTRYPVTKKGEPPLPDRQIRYWLRILGGVNETMPPGGKKYFPHLLSFNAHMALGNISTITGGIELLNNPARIRKLELDSTPISYNENFQAGLKIGHEVTVGPVSLVVEMGAYVYNPYPIAGPLFHRIGVHYRFSQLWTYNMTLRTHWAQADNFEFGLSRLINPGP